MSGESNSVKGQVLWTDLAVPDAKAIKAFYAEVVGFTSEPVDMGGYSDFVLKAFGEAPPSGAVGVCHARGENEHLPPVWMIYFAVDDLDVSLEAVTRLGGEMLGEIRTYGDDRYCAIKDPAGAVCTLFEKSL